MDFDFSDWINDVRSSTTAGRGSRRKLQMTSPLPVGRRDCHETSGA